MSDSIVSMVFLGVLGLLFVLLVVLTIVLIATRKKGDEEEYEEDDSYDEYESDNENDDNYQNLYQDYDEQSDIAYSDNYDKDKDAAYSDDYEENLNNAYNAESDKDEDVTYNDSHSKNSNATYNDSHNKNSNAAYVDGFDENQNAVYDVDSDEKSNIAYDNYVDTLEDSNKDKIEESADNTYDNDQKQASAGKYDNSNKATDENSKEVVTKKAEEANNTQGMDNEAALSKETSNVYEDEMGDYSDSAFAPYNEDDAISNEEAIIASVKEAEAMSEAVMYGKPDAETMFGIGDQLDSYKKKPVKRSTVSSNEEFYWYNKMDVAEKPSYKTKEMYYHYFNLPKDCIEDLLVEMYDCALVRTEEIRYIAYGIEPKAVSIKDILSEGNYYYSDQPKKKEPLPQDLIIIYEKWCGYVDKLFDKVEVHADEFTIQEIRKMLCEFGRNDVDVLLEGK